MAMPFSSVSMSLISDRASSCFAFSTWRDQPDHQKVHNVDIRSFPDNMIQNRKFEAFIAILHTSTFSSPEVGSDRISRALDRRGRSVSPSFCLCSKWLPLRAKESSASMPLHPFSYKQTGTDTRVQFGHVTKNQFWRSCSRLHWKLPLVSIGPLIVPFFFGFHFFENNPPRSPISFSPWKEVWRTKCTITNLFI